MKKPLTDEDLQVRASIDSRVAFAMSAFALAGGLVALLDWIGVPERIVAVLGPIMVLAGLSLIGTLLHAVRVSRFYAAGRAVPAPYGGLAMAAAMTGLFLPFLPPAPSDVPLNGLIAGFAIGFALAALLTGPLLRKTGAFSLPDLVASRFAGAGVRYGMVAVVCAACAAVAIAGLESAIHAISLTIGATRPAAAALAAIVLILMIAPGGMSGVVWAATGAAGIFVAALTLPLASIVLSAEPLPLPAFGDSAQWKAASGLIAQWHERPSSNAGGTLLALAAGLGLATLAPLISPAVCVPDAAAARRAGVSALMWSFAAAMILLASMAVAAIAANEWITGERPDRLPLFAYAASAAGLMTICGKYVSSAQAALAACEQLTGFAGLVLRVQDYEPSGLWLVLGMPELRGYGVAFTGLAGAGLIAIGMVLAAAGFHGFGSALGHDIFYRVRESAALTSRRLAMTRMLTIGAITAGAMLASQVKIDPRALIGFAIVISAAAVTPLIALALWPRAKASDAIIALLAGLLTAGAIIALGGARPGISTLALASVIAPLTGLLAGVATSFLHSASIASEGNNFLHGVLHGQSDVLNADKGA